MDCKRVLSVILCICLCLSLASCALFEPEKSLGDLITYIPLDDRTDNTTDVILLANASGRAQIAMPDKDLYSTHLDGQPANSNGTQFGDSLGLYNYLVQMEENGCNYYIISLDQLLSGGLVNSRCNLGYDNLGLFDALFELLSSDDDNKVIFIDSLMRLASTVGYNGLGEKQYYATREYGMVERPVLSQKDLCLEKIFEGYTKSADGTEALEAVSKDNRSLLTEDLIRDYIAARSRKLTITDHVISKLAEYEAASKAEDAKAKKGKIKKRASFELIIGIDDSSNRNNIQYNELEYIKSIQSENCNIMAGLDSLGRIAVSKLLRDEYADEISVSVNYIGGGENKASSDYDMFTLRQSVDFYLEYFGIKKTAGADAQLNIVVMTASDGKKKDSEYLSMLVSKLEAHKKQGVPAVLIDASNGCYEDIYDELLEKDCIAGLAGFAGKYDHAVVAGAGLAMGLGRFIYLKTHEEIETAVENSHGCQLANAVVLSIYTMDYRYDLNVFIQKMKLDFNNIKCSADERKKIDDRLSSDFEKMTEHVVKAFAGKEIFNPAGNTIIRNIFFYDVCMPWSRTFEIDFRTQINREDETQTDQGDEASGDQ